MDLSKMSTEQLVDAISASGGSEDCADELARRLAAAEAEIEAVFAWDNQHPREQTRGFKLSEYVKTRLVRVWQYNEQVDKREFAEAERDTLRTELAEVRSEKIRWEVIAMEQDEARQEAQDERDTLRQQLEAETTRLSTLLAVAREGLEFYTQHWPSVAEHARDTLAKMEKP